MAMGKRRQRQEVALYHGRRTAEIGRPSVLSTAQLAAGRSRLRSLDREALPALLRARRETRPAFDPAGRVLPHASGGLLRGDRQPARHRLAVRRQSQFAAILGHSAGGNDTRSQDALQHSPPPAGRSVRRGVSVRIANRGREEAAVGQGGGRRQHAVGSSTRRPVSSSHSPTSRHPPTVRQECDHAEDGQHDRRWLGDTCHAEAKYDVVERRVKDGDAER